MPKILSYGGGVQTMAMVRMVLNGDLERPDLVAFADTMRERSATYQSTAREFAMLEAAGIPTVIASRGDLGDWGISGRAPMTPLFTINLKTGTEGQLNVVCSERFKTRAIRKELRRREWKEAEVWIGLTTDEIIRVKPSNVAWATNRWPLIEKSIRRSDCEEYLRKCGVKLEAEFPNDPERAVKSACVMCPHRRTPSFLRMTVEEQNFACDYDEAIRHSRPGYLCFVSDERRPLREVIEAARKQTNLFDLIADVDDCKVGYCFT